MSRFTKGEFERLCRRHMPAKTSLVSQGLARSVNLQTGMQQERFLAKHSPGGVTYLVRPPGGSFTGSDSLTGCLERGDQGSVTRLRLQRRLVDLQATNTLSLIISPLCQDHSSVEPAQTEHHQTQTQSRDPRSKIRSAHHLHQPTSPSQTWPALSVPSS